MTALLLDTCAIIYIAENQAITPIGSPRRSRRRALETASSSASVSAWEIGLLVAKGVIVFLPDPKDWFGSFLRILCETDALYSRNRDRFFVFAATACQIRPTEC